MRGPARRAVIAAWALLAAAPATTLAAGAPPAKAAAAAVKPRPLALDAAAEKALRAELARRGLKPPAVVAQLDALRATDPWVALVQGAERIGGAGAFAYMALDQAFAELGVPAVERMALADSDAAADQLTALGEQMKLFQDPALGIPEPWCASFAQLALDLARARRYAATALAGIPPASRNAIAAALLDLRSVARLPEASPATVDYGALARASGTMLLATDAFLELLPDREPPVFAWRTDVAGVSGFALGPFPTLAGPLYIGGVDVNVWSVPRNAIVVDLGGKDVYASGGERFALPATAALSVILDLSGDDAYRSAAPAAIGAGVMGLALVRDLAGDDVYEDRALAQGTAAFGTGLLLDESGDDRYAVGTSGQGCAHAGVGMLVDGGGEDLYVAGSFGQGVATGQAVGLLADLSGDDVYRARAGIAHDGELEAAQAAGFRLPVDGLPGLGIVLDVAGSDAFLAARRAQAAAAGGRALFIDGGGDDVLRCADAKSCRGVVEGDGRAFLIDLGAKPPVRIGLPASPAAAPAGKGAK